MIVIISILFLSVSSIIIDPINTTCINNSSFSLQYNDELSTNLHFFNLPPFSQSIIIIDLRHLIQIPKIQNQSYFTLKSILIQQSLLFQTVFQNIEAKSNIYKLFVDKNTKLGIYFDIIVGYQAYKYLLFQSVSIQIIEENYRIVGQSSSFLFVISSKDNINLPINRPNVQSYSGYYLNKITQNETSQGSSNLQSSNSYWTTFSSLAIPFIPYISNCKGETNRMFISQIIQNNTQCNLIKITDTIPIDQFKFGSLPTADTCDINRQCVYDQIPGISSQFPYWLNLPSGSVLFSITQDKVHYSNYQINNNFDSNNLVPCKINQSKGDNTSSQYPLNVKLTLQYYQYSQQVKKMISCTVDFSLYMDSSPNFTYQFQLQMKPLNHTYIMLAFGFQWYVYMIVFVIIGFISNMENLVLWLFHFSVSRKKKKPFKIMVYLKIIGQISKGTFIALFFCSILVFSVCLIMNGKIFQKTIYSSNLDTSTPRVFWDYINNNYIDDYTSDLAVQFRSGRMGLTFLITGSLLLFYMSKFFIGYQKKKKQYNQYQIMGRQLKPRQWNRGKFIFGTYVYIFIQFFFIYFAYSSLYSQNIWTFIVLMKIIQIIMQEITLSIYQDLLPCLPFKVITDITAYMNTLSANNLYDFLFSFLIDVAMTMIEKAYIPQLQNMVVQKILQKMNQLFKFYAHLVNDTQQKINENVQSQIQQAQQQNQFVLLNGQSQQVKFFENQQIQTYNDDDQIDIKINEIISLQKKISNRLLNYRKFESKQFAQNHNNNNNNNNQTQQIQNIDKNQQQKIQECSIIFQILLDNILLLFTFILQPFILLVCWVSYDQSKILNNYGIAYNVVILYSLSAIVIAVFTINNMVLIFQLLESYLEIDFDQKITHLLNRFFQRKLFWKANDEDLNMEIKVTYRGADHYCLSWQFFFILAIYVGSMSLVIIGLSIMINSNYNPFKDSAMVLVLIFWSLFIILAIWLVKKLAYKLDIDQWRTKYGEQTSNSNAIVDYSVKQQINMRNDESENQTGPQICSHQNSQHQLIGSTIHLKKANKLKFNEKIQSFKQYGNSQFAQMNQSDEDSSCMSEQTLNTKVNTICKKLQSKFSSNKFNIEYFKKNKQFLKQNIEKILPLVDQLPEITQYRIAKNQSSANQKKGKKDNKMSQHIIEHVIKRWKQKVDSVQKQRQRNGKQLQQNLKECEFCFSPVGIYFGYGGMCLKCSSKFNKQKKQV